jgi:hypothetical protein
MGKSNEADCRDYLTAKRTVKDCETQQSGSVPIEEGYMWFEAVTPGLVL